MPWPDFLRFFKQTQRRDQQIGGKFLELKPSFIDKTIKKHKKNIERASKHPLKTFMSDSFLAKPFLVQGKATFVSHNYRSVTRTDRREMRKKKSKKMRWCFHLPGFAQVFFFLKGFWPHLRGLLVLFGGLLRYKSKFTFASHALLEYPD